MSLWNQKFQPIRYVDLIFTFDKGPTIYFYQKNT